MKSKYITTKQKKRHYKYDIQVRTGISNSILCKLGIVKKKGRKKVNKNK